MSGMQQGMQYVYASAGWLVCMHTLWLWLEHNALGHLEYFMLGKFQHWLT